MMGYHWVVGSLIATLIAACVCQQTVYISPNGTNIEGCGSESNPCATLDFAKEQSNSYNTTIFLEPGFYNLSSIQVNDMCLTITASINTVVIQTINSIWQSGNEPFCSAMNSTIIFSNLNISRTNSTFVFASTSHVEVLNCQFENFNFQTINVNTSSLIIIDTQFYNSTDQASENIGTNSFIECNECHFMNLLRVEVANIQVVNPGLFTIGILIRAHNSDLIISNDENIISIRDCSFRNISILSSVQQYHGTITIASVTQVIIDRVTFENFNITVQAPDGEELATVSGYYVLIDQVWNTTISNSTFDSSVFNMLNAKNRTGVRCSSYLGGSLYIQGFHLSLDSLIFRNNIVTINTKMLKGGLIIIPNYGFLNITMQDCKFFNNSVIATGVSVAGGCVHINLFYEVTTFKITDNQFCYNSITANDHVVTINGAAMYIETVFPQNIINTIFVGNSIYHGPLEVISDHTRLTQGAGLFLKCQHISYGAFNVSNCSFRDNYIIASGYDVDCSGGGLSVLGSANIKYSEFSGNYIHTIAETNEVRDNFAASFNSAGAGLFMESGIITIQYSNFTNNSLVDYTHNTNRGGAVASLGLIFAITNSNFSNNFIWSANGTALGGAIYYTIGDYIYEQLIYGEVFCNIFFSSFQNNSVHVNQGSTSVGITAGGAVYGDNQYTHIYRTIFLDNTVIGNTILPSGVGKLQQRTLVGGAICINALALILNSTEFVRNSIILSLDNQSSFGGAVAFILMGQYSIPYLLLTDSQFDSNFIESTDFSTAQGGAVWVSALQSETFRQMQIYFMNLQFLHNYISCGENSQVFGGAMYVECGRLSTALLFNGTVSGNYIQGQPTYVEGGALCFYTSTEVIIVPGTTISSNWITASSPSGIAAASGGGISINADRAIFNGTDISNNTITFTGNGVSQGGGVHSTSHLQLDRCSFSNNTLYGSMETVSNGGAVYSEALVMINESEFLLNTANGGSGGGGALYCSSIQLFNSSVESNGINMFNSAKGGSINLFGSNENSTLTNLTIKYSWCTAAECFGGSFFASSQFVNCTAVVVQNSVVNAKRCVGAGIFAINSTISGSNIGILNNTCTNFDYAAGGGIFINGALQLENSVISDNGLALAPEQTCNTITQALEGGGVYSEFQCQLTNCTVLQNYAQYGGGIFLFNIVSISLNSTNLTSNSAVYGGGIFVQDPITDSISNSSQWGATYSENVALHQSNMTSQINSFHVDQCNITVYSGAKFEAILWFDDIFSAIIPNSSLVVIANANHLPFVTTNVPQDVITVDCSGYYNFPAIQVNPPEIGKFTITYSAESPTHYANSLWSKAQQVNVAECPPYLLSTNSNNRTDCVLCLSGYYTSNSGTCNPCPNRGNCLSFINMNTFVIQSSFPSSWDNPNYLLACLNDQACKSEYNCVIEFEDETQQWVTICDVCEQSLNSDCHCNEGYSDRLCSKCVFTEDVCYYPASDHTCVNYQDKVGGLILPFLSMIVYYLGSVLFYAAPKTASATVELKTLTFFVQTTTVLNNEIIHNGLIEFLSSLFGLFNSHTALRCFSYKWFSNETTVFLTNAVVSSVLKSVGVIFVVFLKVLVGWWWKKRKNSYQSLEVLNNDIFELDQFTELEDHSSVQNFKKADIIRAFLKDCTQVILYLCYSIYFSIATEVFTIWNCSPDADGVLYSRFYPWMECSLDDPEWSSLFIASLGCSLFVVCILVLFSGLLIYSKIANSPNRDPKANLLYHCFG
jgi:hypothetical protein